MPRRRATLLTGRAGVRPILWKGRRAFYRITGYFDGAGIWYVRDPDNGHWYQEHGGRHLGAAPTIEQLNASRTLSIEIEVEGDPEIHHFAVQPGMLG